jgi:hypothetical protein
MSFSHRDSTFLVRNCNCVHILAFARFQMQC